MSFTDLSSYAPMTVVLQIGTSEPLQAVMTRPLQFVSPSSDKTWDHVRHLFNSYLAHVANDEDRTRTRRFLRRCPEQAEHFYLTHLFQLRNQVNLETLLTRTPEEWIRHYDTLTTTAPPATCDIPQCDATCECVNVDVDPEEDDEDYEEMDEEDEESAYEEVKSSPSATASRQTTYVKKRSRSEEEEYSPYNHKKTRPVPAEEEDDEEYLPYEHTLRAGPSSTAATVATAVTTRSEASAIDAAVKGLLRLSQAAPLAVDLDLVAERVAQFKRRFR
jgi:hypothetical protein